MKRRAKARAEQRWDINRSAKWQARVAKEFDRLVSVGELKLWQEGEASVSFHVPDGCFTQVITREVYGVRAYLEVEVLLDPENREIVYFKANGPNGALGRFPSEKVLCVTCFSSLWDRHVLHKEQTEQQ